MTDTTTITAFMATHARLLDRRRADVALGRGGADAALAALAGYRNPDGGFGWGIEPASGRVFRGCWHARLPAPASALRRRRSRLVH